MNAREKIFSILCSLPRASVSLSGTCFHILFIAAKSIEGMARGDGLGTQPFPQSPSQRGSSDS